MRGEPPKRPTKKPGTLSAEAPLWSSPGPDEEERLALTCEFLNECEECFVVSWCTAQGELVHARELKSRHCEQTYAGDAFVVYRDGDAVGRVSDLAPERVKCWYRPDRVPGGAEIKFKFRYSAT